MSIIDTVRKLAEKKSEKSARFKEMQEEYRLNKMLEDRQKSSAERSIEKYHKDNREKRMQEEVKKIQKIQSKVMWIDNSILKSGNKILDNNNSVLKSGKSMLKQKNIFANNKNIFNNSGGNTKW